MRPKVSIIMPAFNTGDYLPEAIASALAQSEPSLEVIVIDDASTDNTAEVARRINDERVRLLINSENRGPGFSRNRGLASARGEWIALLDSDDWYAPQRLERLLTVAVKEDLDLVADDQFMVKDGEKQPWSSKWRRRGLEKGPPRRIDVNSFVALDLGMKPFFRRAFLTQHGITFDNSLKFGEDYLFILDCLLRNARSMLIPEGYYYYRSRPDSLITDQVNLHAQTYETTRRLLKNELVAGNDRLVQQLEGRLEKISRGMRYQRFVGPLKKGFFVEAGRNLLDDPAVVLHLLSSLPDILRHRMPRIGRSRQPERPNASGNPEWK